MIVLKKEQLKSDFGAIIKKDMRALGMYQVALANKAKVSTSTVSRIINSNFAKVGMQSVLKVVEVTKTPIKSLVHGTTVIDVINPVETASRKVAISRKVSALLKEIQNLEKDYKDKNLEIKFEINYNESGIDHTLHNLIFTD